jgi:long-chain acyl-CoA synthetase
MTVAPLNAASPPTTPHPVYTAPTRAGRALLGRTLLSLLDEACTNNPNPQAFNEPTSSGWHTLSSQDFRAQAETLALALRDTGLAAGERVAFFTHSDLSFCLPDMACLMAGLVSVPIYLTQNPEAVRFILQETEAKMVVVSDAQLLAKLEPLLKETSVQTVLLRDAAGASAPAGVTCTTLETLTQRGEALLKQQPEAGKALRQQVQAGDLATIIYTSGTTGTPKGVMLTHENLSSNVLAAFSAIPELKRGQEVALSFLPLTHVFARTLHYGYLAWGSAVYFTTPEKLRVHLKEVRPTTFATVPRVLERVFEGILKAGAELSGVKKPIFEWAISVARRFEPEGSERALYSTQRRAADKLVFDKWREALGGRLKLVVVGGAALRPELVRVFGAAGVEVLQGYGLTETSPIVAFNRPHHNRPGTVGELLAGAEVRLTKEGEILTRGPQVMKGYFNNPEATAAAIDQDGWFHTGDLGSMSADGFLTITGRLKNLFKLSTGKFIMPQPLETALEASPHIEHALVVGEGEKYCAALLFLAPATDPEKVKDEVKRFAQEANRALPHWAQAKRVLLLSDTLSIDNDLLTPTLKVKRKQVLELYQARVSALFGHSSGEGDAARTIELEP